jgi:hypothetical protein
MYILQTCRSIHLHLIFEKSCLKNQVRRTRLLLPVLHAKIDFEIDFCRLKIQFVKLEFSNLIVQKSSTDG